ncbi:MAG: hypothetical protein ACE5H1_03665 [Thermodesulfobacteriota bacterium]
MNIYIETKEDKTSHQGMERVITFGSGRAIYANLKDASFRLDLGNGRLICLYGDIFYHIRGDGKIKLIDSNCKKYLKKVFSENNLKDVISNLEGQYIGIYVNEPKQIVRVFSDRYARCDSFYWYSNSNFYFSSSLDFIFKNVVPEYDQKMLAHIFFVYGWYTPKGLTIYRNVKQLRVGEIITLSDSGIYSEEIEFKPLEIENYTDEDLEVYYKILRESVIARANSKEQTWVSSSSGWDSSMLLSLLIDEFGLKKVGMITESLQYSERTGVINNFEVNKTQKIGEFYGIKPFIVDIDLKNKTAPNYWEKILPYYRSKHMYSFTTFDMSRLSDGLKDVAEKGQTIFNGDTSDAFHNFGFSQYTTFFHTKKPFTEYADKMNCYLYGPSFFRKVIDGTYEKDKVFQIFKRMTEGVEFASKWNNREETIESYLFPFIYGSPRVPFARVYLNPALKEKGQRAVYNFPFREFIPEVLSGLSEKNIYSWLIYLYHSFHTQGSTANTPKHAMEFNNHKWRMPFSDIRLINFLSKASEKWGRSLEINNTKYPLKWVARNKIKFPYELLEEGPHSYLFSVIEGISLYAEFTYRSGVTEFFKDAVRDRPYRDILSEEYFDISYLDNLVADYLNGKEISGGDFNNLVSLITLCITGWY